MLNARGAALFRPQTHYDGVRPLGERLPGPARGQFCPLGVHLLGHRRRRRFPVEAMVGVVVVMS